MTIETSLHAALESSTAVTNTVGISPARIFATSFPMNVELPAISYFRTGSDPINYLDGTVDDTRNDKFEVVAWAQTYAAAKDLADAVQAAFATASDFSAVWTGHTDNYNPAPEIFFVVQEFSIWSTNL